MKTFRLLILSLSVVLLATSTYAGMLMFYLFAFLLLSLAAMLVTHFISFTKKRIDWSLSAKELTLRTYILRGVLRNTAWLAIGTCIYISQPIQFSPNLFAGLTIVVWGSVVVLCFLDWIPRMHVGKSLNITLSAFLLVLAYQLTLTYLPAHSNNRIELVTPFKDDWYIFHGGNSALVNYHHFAGSQKYAFDIIVPDDGILSLNPITDLQQYKSFGKSLYSPVDGIIVAVQNSLPDQKIGVTDRQNIAGNNVVIKTEAGIFLLMAHLPLCQDGCTPTFREF